MQASLNKEEIIPLPKKAGFRGRLFGIIKLILGISLLPFVYSATRAFLSEFSILERRINHYFFGGIISFLIIYLFIYEPATIYSKGHKILEIIFRFFTPLVKVAPYLLPIYTIILFGLCGLFLLLSKADGSIRYFVFLLGFSIALHLVFSAKSLRRRESDFLRANYIFGFSFIYIVNMAILSFGLSILFDKFSFVNFCNNSFQIAKDIFGVVFKQLFCNRQ